MKYLPRDVSDFERMIQDHYIYIDKTKLIYDLYATGGRYFFLSRPRRFGKSLLVSTLKELFLGNKKLFENLWISRPGVWDWQEHPIIHLDFSVIDHKTAHELEVSIMWALTNIAQQYNLDITAAPTMGTKFAYLVEQLAKRYNKVVVLIDEYDKPILDHISNVPMAQAQQLVLKSFYDVLKGLDNFTRSILLTGVTKFSRTSLFSGLNNLIDITMAPEAATLLGYTKQEIEHYFAEYIREFAQAKQISTQAIMQEMEQWYNGYRFSRQEITVYNPFSVLYYLQNQELENYWFESGTPTFLISLLKNNYSSLEGIQDITVSTDSLGTFVLEDVPLVPLLFQTGYLTIINYDPQTRLYRLGYPNTEVRESFTKYIIAALTDTNPACINNLLLRMIQALKTHNIDLFCELLQSLLAHIPYNLYIKQERYFHSLFQFLGTLLSFEIQSEVVTDKGRIDLVVKTREYIYIFEFKFNTSPDVALRQADSARRRPSFVALATIVAPMACPLYNFGRRATTAGIEENKYYERY